MASIESLKQGPDHVEAGRAPRLILFLTVFIDLLGFGIVIPFLPMFAERMGIGAAGIGLIFSSYSLMQFIFAPILGRMSDRFGRKPIIMLGLIGSSLGYLVYGFADSFFWLLAARAIHGACAATISTAQAYVADTTDERDRAKGMGLIGAAFGLGFVLGPAVGGILGHTSLRAPVFFASALTFGNFLFAAFRLPESHYPDRSRRLDLRHFIAPVLAIPRELVQHRLARMFAIAFLLTFSFATLEATFALMVPAIYGYGAFGIGVLLAFTGLMQAVAQGYLLGVIVHKVGEARLVRLGLVAMAIGLAPMGTIASRDALLAMLAIIAVGYGLASPSIASLISRNTERHLQGEVLGVNQSALSLARICGPIAGGILYQLMGPSAPYFGGAAIALLAFALCNGIETGGV
ncbi:MAG: MFS transporter [Candidatus Binatus sp.]|uniref:MFS transporter n=1 Tax=Candidatus Binatus sp. TaxID=2811406 RepID=UPI00271F03C0|nr:MFS transporter [Candidatus Binatus sp.]MDO8431970.1 MFS transporter [Candidatus Binatus sp.]